MNCILPLLAVQFNSSAPHPCGARLGHHDLSSATMAPPSDSGDKGFMDDLAQRFRRLRLRLRRNSSPSTTSHPAQSNHPSPSPPRPSRPLRPPAARPVPYDSHNLPRPPIVMPI